jgi:uncharacterized membrane protein
MTPATLKRILAIGTITGMRSMAGAATLAAQHGGLLKRATALMAAGEMAADKTAVIGNRTDALPLTGRAVMGALVGGLVAREHGDAVLLGGLVGAATAVLATHLAYQLRTRLPLGTTAGGLLEDAIVIGAGTLYARRDDVRY